MPSILIVDDLTAIHEMLAAVIQPTGFSMAFAEDGNSALEQYKSGEFEVVLADISMTPMDGIELLRHLKQYDPDCVAIMMTGYASTETAIKALKHGAFDYIQKPFKIDELLKTLKRAVEFRARAKGQARGGAAEEEISLDIDSRLVGRGEANRRLVQQVRKLIHVHTPILLLGETGTGRRSIAEIVHAGQSGKDKPFILVDCAQVGEDALRVSLLGENGAPGEWIARSRGGTLCLQNIETLGPAAQEGLVAVIKRCVSDTRIICTSADDLEARMEEGLFDDELFYRIATLPIHVVPLRERLEDLPELIRFFLAKAKNPRFESAQIEFSPAALEAMRAYPWPGNVLELQQIVTSVASSTENRVIDPAGLPRKVTSMEGWPTLEEHLARQERRYIRIVLNAAGGDREKAARILGCDPAKLDGVENPVEAESVNS